MMLIKGVPLPDYYLHICTVPLLYMNLHTLVGKECYYMSLNFSTYFVEN